MKETRLDNVPQSFKLPDESKMNNPGIDLAIWERLRKRWARFESAGHKLKIDFHLLADIDDEKNILAIDVIQNINDDIFVETVQRNAGEAYKVLGINGLSKERLIEVCKEMMRQLHGQAKHQDVDLIVTMAPSSPTSGETRGYVEERQSHIKSSVLVNYQQYYLLNALREKMIESTGDGWSKVTAVYRSGDLEFYFEY